MKTIINYTELSQLTEGKFTFTRISEESIKISGKIKVLMISKDISIVLKIERVGFSSISFSTDSPSLVSTGLMFIPRNFRKAVTNIGDGVIKLDLKEIPELLKITEKLKLDSLKFEESGITLKISPRP